MIIISVKTVTSKHAYDDQRHSDVVYKRMELAHALTETDQRGKCAKETQQKRRPEVRKK